MHRRLSAALLPLLAVAVSAACSKTEAPPPSPSPYAPPPTTAAAVKVVDIEVGRAVDMDKRISDKTDSFKPTETIYVSVATEGSSPGATLAAHWTYQDGQVVKHDDTSVAPSSTVVRARAVMYCSREISLVRMLESSSRASAAMVTSRSARRMFACSESTCGGPSNGRDSP